MCHLCFALFCVFSMLHMSHELGIVLSSRECWVCGHAQLKLSVFIYSFIYFEFILLIISL